MSLSSGRRASFARQLAIALTLIVLLLPFLWLLQMSFKSNDLILQFPPPLIFTPTLANYASLWQSAFSASFVNSLLSASFSTAFALLFGVPAAYALSKWAGRGKRALGFAILVTRMAPPIAFTIPFFLFYRWIGLLDTVTGLVLIYTSFNLPLVIWMMQPFFETVPASLEEALNCLEDDHGFLMKGDVFTEELIETFIDYKRKNEADAIRLRPHPYEFALYYDV